MDAAAEAEMAARLAGDVVGIWIGKLAFVAIGRSLGEADEVAGVHGLAVQRHVLLHAAAEALR